MLVPPQVEVFDAIAPDVERGRLAVVANLFQLAMGEGWAALKSSVD